MDPLNTTDPSLIWPNDPSFRNFPKRLPEDCVEYTIHVIDSALSNAALRSRLLEIQRAAEKLKKELLKGYIWQREGFDLALSGAAGQQSASRSNEIESSSSGTDGNAPDDDLTAPTQAQAHSLGLKSKDSDDAVPLHLHGRSAVGDSVVDEWLIVYLLRILSQQIPEVWIRIWDSDGEFPLIEAANALPPWLDPDIAEHRVWIHEGHLLIIPMQTYQAKTKKKRGSNPSRLTLSAALNHLKAHSLKTDSPSQPLLDDPRVNTEAFSRINSYPASIPQNLHTTTARLPRKLSYLLHRQPQWISPAIEAFYLRDPIAMRTLHGKGEGKLTFPPEDMVDIAVKMQRVGFAQLRGQDFETPKAWSDYKPSKAPNTGGVKEGLDPTTELRRKDAGMKLTVGFEILLTDPGNKDKQAVREMQLLLSDLEDGEEELPSDAEIQSWRDAPEGKEDSEEWLNIDWAAFERELKGQQQEKPDPAAASKESTKERDGEKATVTVEPDSGFGDKEAQANLRRMIGRFEDFLKTEKEVDSESKTNTADEEDDEDEDDDDDSYHPSDSDDSEQGSSEEEGWSPDDSDDPNDSNGSGGEEDTANRRLPMAEIAPRDKGESEEPTETDAHLQSIISEMKEMGIAPPPQAPSKTETDELREALMTLGDFEPPESLRSGTASGSERASKDGGLGMGKAVEKGKGKATPSSRTSATTRKEADYDDVEEIPRDVSTTLNTTLNTAIEDAEEGNELSSDDDELDGLNPADIRNFEEMFGRELRAAGALK